MVDLSVLIPIYPVCHIPYSFFLSRLSQHYHIYGEFGGISGEAAKKNHNKKPLEIALNLQKTAIPRGILLSRKKGSNLQPTHYECAALPLSYSGKFIWIYKIKKSSSYAKSC